MRRIFTVITVILVSMLTAGIGADGGAPDRVSSMIAVMDLNCGKDIDSKLKAPLTNIVIDELVQQNKFTVIDRANRDKILSEVGFQMTGCADESCTVEAGRLLGVGKIVVGSVDKFSSTYLISLQLINVETAAVEASATEKCKCEVDGLIDSVRAATVKLVEDKKDPAAKPEVKTPPPPVSPPPPIEPDKTGTEFIAATPEQLKLCPAEMVYVPAGNFIMGCSAIEDKECQSNEEPIHKIYLDAFCVDKLEATVSQYAQCIKSGKCSVPGTKYNLDSDKCNWGKSDKMNHPINCIDWNQSDEYCKYQGEQLPTEAQWEKSARGTDGRKFPWGDEPPNCEYAVMADNGQGCGHNETWPVGSKPKGASPYGALDMAGNVWEWVQDWHDKDYYRKSPTQNPTGPAAGKEKILRGGGWPYDATSQRTTRRHTSKPDNGSTRRGVRCAAVPASL